MRVNIFRNDSAASAKGKFESFEVPAGQHWTAMDLLDYIALAIMGFADAAPSRSTGRYSSHALSRFRLSNC